MTGIHGAYTIFLAAPAPWIRHGYHQMNINKALETTNRFENLAISTSLRSLSGFQCDFLHTNPPERQKPPSPRQLANCKGGLNCFFFRLGDSFSRTDPWYFNGYMNAYYGWVQV